MPSNDPHQLDPLLRPRSVAVIGASDREGSLGQWTLRNLLKGGYAGAIYPVNPRYDSLQGIACYRRLADLPETPELAIFAVGDAAIESALDDAIAVGVKAVSIMSPLILDDDRTPLLKERIAVKLFDAGVRACGANGMGFYNVRDNVWACGFDSADHRPPGKISLISHSGSGMSGLIDCDERLDINFAVSTGNEIDVTMDEYLDFALDLPETRVVGLFIETARNPQRFRNALQKANDRRIPVVALKVGRTERAASLTVSHSGAMAGDDASYDALFDRYGVQRVRDMDELATTLIMFAELHPVGPGGLVSLHDSGGERQLIIDLAEHAGVALTEISVSTEEKLAEVLDPELPAVNPLDAWSRGGHSAFDQMVGCLTLLMQDEGAALGAVVQDRAPYGRIYPSHIKYMQKARAASGKPVALVAARQGTGGDASVAKCTQEGMPVLDGVPSFLAGVRALFCYRDFLARPRAAPPQTPSGVASKWRDTVSSSTSIDELRSLEMLADFGIDTVPCLQATSLAELSSGADQIGWPLAMKTAMPGIAHKSDRGGVILDLNNLTQLESAWQEMSANLGARVLLAKMADAGVEMLLGSRCDPQFGPVVVAGIGGIHAEVLHDVSFLLPPFDAATARRHIDKLRMRKLLDGLRGQPACDIDAFCETAARFSVMIYELRDCIDEIDVNPIIVSKVGCRVVDALVIPTVST